MENEPFKIILEGSHTRTYTGLMIHLMKEVTHLLAVQAEHGPAY